MKQLIVGAFLFLGLALMGCSKSSRVSDCQEKLMFAKPSPDGQRILVVFSQLCDLGITTGYVNIASIRQASEWSAHKTVFPDQYGLVGIDAGGDSISNTSGWIDNRTVVIKLDHKGLEKKMHDQVLGTRYRMAYPPE